MTWTNQDINLNNLMTWNCPHHQLPLSPLVAEEKNKNELKLKYHNRNKHCNVAMVEWLHVLGDN